ncbi:MAG: MMPL family transporter [Spirochaetota bacterium]|nr:MMPL family transporter [Spirochaetota bacterium]
MNRKDNFVTKINDRFADLAERVIDHRWVVFFICLTLFIGLTVLSLKQRIDTSMEVWFLDGDPSFNYYHNFVREFGNDEFIYIVYRTKQGIFNLDSLSKTKRLVEDLEEIPYVEKVNAITNIELTEGSVNGDLNVYSLMNEFPSSQVEANSLMHKIMDKPLYVNSYISEDSNFAAILCELENKAKDDPTYNVNIATSLERILSKLDYEDFRFWPVGEPISNFEFYKIVIKDGIIINTIAYFLIFLLLVLFFRQAKVIGGIFLVTIFSLVFVVGIMKIIDFPITALSVITPSLILAIGVATSIHLITEYHSHVKSGYTNRTSIIKAVSMVGFPCLFTSLTTAVGFASVTISPISILREYGWSIVVGVLVVFVFSFSILLVILTFKKEKTGRKFNGGKVNKGNGLIDWMLPRIASLNKRYYIRILIISAIVSIICSYGITKLQVNSSWLGKFGDRTKVYHDFKFVDKTMAVSASFEISLDSKKADGVRTYQFVKTLEQIQNFAESKDYLVKKTVSVVDIIRDVNRSLHNNDIEYYRLPSSDREVSQYILLYEISGGEELEKLVSADLATARLTIYIKSTDSITSRGFYDELVNFIESVKPADYDYRITGLSFLLLEAMRYIADNQIKSIMLAFVIISLMMVIVFRSIKVGLISMLPNLFPIVITLGFMGLSGIWLDFGRSLLAPIAIGLAVDDTIHVISRYRLEFFRIGNYEKALDVAMNEVGRAITITTYSICCLYL